MPFRPSVTCAKCSLGGRAPWRRDAFITGIQSPGAQNTPSMLTKSIFVKTQLAPCFLSLTQARDATGSQLALLDHSHDRNPNSSQHLTDEALCFHCQLGCFCSALSPRQSPRQVSEPEPSGSKVHVVYYSVVSRVLFLADMLNAYVDERDSFSISVPEGMPDHEPLRHPAA